MYINVSIFQCIFLTWYRTLAIALTPSLTTLVILTIVDATVGLRVSADHEIEGLDLSQHGEEGYNLES